MSNTILVTGATGFVGKRLAELLKEAGFNVHGVSSTDGEISSSEWWPHKEAGFYTHVFHCAGATFVPKSWEDPISFYKTNVLGTASVLEYCKKYDLPLTYVSAYVYGNEVSNPIAENSKLNPNNPYAVSKLLGENLCLFYANTFNLKIQIVRPFNIYGPGQNENFLIPFVIQQMIGGEQIKVKDLYPIRDYIFVDDVVSCLIATMRLKGFNILNAGSSVGTSVKELIDIIQKVSGKTLKILSDQEVRSNEISCTIANISEAKRLLDWTPKNSLEEGLRKVIENKHD